MRRHVFVAFALVVMFAQATCTQVALGQENHTDGVPQLSSRPGAAYTIFIDPAGFNYTGMWIGELPGSNLGLYGYGPDDTFNETDQNAIRAIWAQMANQYRCFDVNITTVDPAIAAGQAANDLERQDYYDSQVGMMHTVIGPPGNKGWQGSADGLAGLGVIDTVQSGGEHTNWMFSQDVDNGDPVLDGTYIGSISSHEGGHTFGCRHQGDFMDGTLVAEYGSGDSSSGPGSYVGIMGNGSDRQRVTWRVGTAHDDKDVPFTQNDVEVIAGNNGMTFVDSGHGHTFATAQPLPVNKSGDIDVTSDLHRGLISPLAPYEPLGYENYTPDYFSFTTDGKQTIELMVHNGNDLLEPGTADNGATLRSFVSIYDADMNFVADGIEDSSTLMTTYSGSPAAGSYFVEITSFGGHMENSGFDMAVYFDMGGYFLTGSGFDAMAPLIGDVNCDGSINLLDVQPFIDIVSNGQYSVKADINSDGSVNLLDVEPFIVLLGSP